MKKMPGLFKRACLLGFAAALVLPTLSFAQVRLSLVKPELVPVIMDSLASSLSLADSQKVKMQKIIMHAISENKDALETYADDREILELMRKNNEDRMDREIKKLLTSEQMKKLEELKIDLFKAKREKSEERKRMRKKKKEKTKGDKTEN